MTAVVTLPATRETPGLRGSFGPTVGWSLLALMWGYPVLWLLGVATFGWALVALPAAVWLFHQRARVVVPRGFGLWLLFLGWVVISGLMLREVDRIAAALYRGSTYVAAGVLLLLVLNLGERRLSTRSVVLACTALWSAAVGLALLALVLPDLEARSALELLLPEPVRSVPFISAIVHPQLAVQDPLLGTIRPTPLFPYTNNWGSGVAILTPVAIYAMITARTAAGRVALALGLLASLVPIVVSINRGLWISLAVGMAYVLGRLLLRGRLWSFIAAAAVVAVALASLMATPLGALIQERIDTPNVTTRQTLYTASLEAAEQSPVLGYGAPISSEGLDDSNDVSIGTHGQFWTLLVSQGYPGALLFLAFVVGQLVRTWSVPDAMLWLHAVPVVLLAQLPVYDPLPVGLCVTFLCLALCLRPQFETVPATWLAARRTERARHV